MLDKIWWKWVNFIDAITHGIQNVKIFITRNIETVKHFSTVSEGLQILHYTLQRTKVFDHFGHFFKNTRHSGRV